MLGIHQDQLLMLLFVMQAELDDGIEVPVAAVEQCDHGVRTWQR